MAQRITIAVAVVLGLAAVVACGVLWSSVRQTRELLADALAENRAQTEQNAEANAALLARIEELSKSADEVSSFAMEWNPIQLKLVKGEDGTEPAVGYRGTLTGGVYESNGMTRYSDKAGLLDFGHVQPGHYTVRLSTPWGAYRTLGFDITPGTKIDRTIHCPAEEVVEADVRLEVEWPDDLPEEIDMAHITVSDPVQPFGDDAWQLPGRSSDFLVKRDGTVTRIHSNQISSMGFPGRRSPGSLGISIARFQEGRPRFPESEQWRTARYNVVRIALVWDLSELMTPRYSRDSSDSRDSAFARPNPSTMGIVSQATVNLQLEEGELPLGEPQVFTPQASDENVWRITLPPPMVEQARERIRNYQQARRERPVEAPRPRDPRASEFERRLRERGRSGFEPRAGGFRRD